jgi:hypothetical protein
MSFFEKIKIYFTENTGGKIFFRAGCILIALCYLLIESSGTGDLFIFLSASSDVFEGVDIYNKHYVDGYHYLYSVFFAILLKPLTFLPFRLARFLWLAINAFLLFRIFKICFSFFPADELRADGKKFSQNKKMFFILLPFIFCLRFILDNFHLAQITILILYLSLEGYNLITQKNKWYGTVFIALGINIKLFPLVIIPLLLYRKKFLAAFLVIFLREFFILFRRFLLA